MKVQFPLRKWKKFLLKNKEKTLEVKLRLKQEKSWVEYPAFEWYITQEAVDPYLVYQLAPTHPDCVGQSGHLPTQFGRISTKTACWTTVLPTPTA